MNISETLYLVLTGTLSAIGAWVIINAFKYIYQKIKTLYSDIKQIKTEMDELKSKVKILEDQVKRNE